MAEKRKLLYWEGSSKKDFKEFPVPVQKDMGVALFVVQLGRTPESAKPQVRHCHTAAGRGIDRKAVEGSTRPLWRGQEIVMTRKDHPRGTDNVLADLGFADAEELSAKAILAVKLNELIDKRSLSQIEAARITGMT
jgi:Helix-turn-helix domain